MPNASLRRFLVTLLCLAMVLQGLPHAFALGRQSEEGRRQLTTTLDLGDGRSMEIAIERIDGTAFPSGAELRAYEMGTPNAPVAAAKNAIGADFFAALAGLAQGQRASCWPSVYLSLEQNGEEAELACPAHVTMRTRADAWSDDFVYTIVSLSPDAAKAVVDAMSRGAEAAVVAQGLVAPQDFECLAANRSLCEDSMASTSVTVQHPGALCVVGIAPAPVDGPPSGQRNVEGPGQATTEGADEMAQTSDGLVDLLSEPVDNQGANPTAVPDASSGSGQPDAGETGASTRSVLPPTVLTVSAQEAPGGNASSTQGPTTLRAQAAEQETATTFRIKGERGAASCTALVRYVDQFQKPLQGVVTGTEVISYDTANPGVPNSINSYDLYTLKDKLADGYKEDYEFSRVYLAMNNKVQKDFRSLCISTDRDIQGSGSTYTRMYTFLNDIKEETKWGGVYYGTWYTLPGKGNNATNDVCIEFNHVREVAFNAVDVAGGPVSGANYALYSDEICYTEFEYLDRSPGATYESEHVPVTAVSNGDGAVSFGKIPYGTYYMKEVQVPAGYKDMGSTYKIVVGDTVTIYKATAAGYEVVTGVVHEWDDGSEILNGLQSMTIKKSWAGDSDGSGHTGYSVTVEVYSKDVVNGKETDTPAPGSPYTLNSSNNWESTITGLNPRLSYVVAETSVKQGDVSQTDEWIPHIESSVTSDQYEYYRAEAFKKGEEYVLSTGNDTALSGRDGALSVASLAANTDVVTGGVTNDMLWKVERINNDGVITLKNMQEGKYLDFVSSAWTVASDAPKFIRHTNSNGDINLYYRENTNASATTYLSIRDGAVVNSSNAPSPSLFDIYQKIDVKSTNVTITNKRTTYPVKFCNCLYDTDPMQYLSGMKFAVYSDVEYNKYAAGQAASALAGANDLASGNGGWLAQSGSQGAQVFSLEAGTYYLVQKEAMDGYRSFSPVKFIVTRGGMLWAQQDLPNFEYTTKDADKNLVLQVPSFKLRTVTVKKVLDDAYSLGTNPAFDFTATLVDPNEKKNIAGWDFGSGRISGQDGSVAFKLSHNGTCDLVVPVGARLSVTETTQGYVTKVAVGNDGPERGNTYAQIVPDAANTVTFTNIRPVCKIVLSDGELPFESISAALAYARENMPGQPVTIQMLVGVYDMPTSDVVIGSGEDVTILTADLAGASYDGPFPYVGESGTAAVIRRATGNASGSLFVVGDAGGKLTLQGVTLDGNGDASVTASGPGGLVRVMAGEFVADGQTTLRNSHTSGDGGALYVASGAQATLDGTQFEGNAAAAGQYGADVYLAANGKVLISGDARIASTSSNVGALYLAQGASGSEIEVVGDLTDGASVHVWAADAARDGANMTADEPFGMTTATKAADVGGLERIISQRGDEGVTAAPGQNNTVVWTRYGVAEVALNVEGEFADRNKGFDIVFTVPADTPRVTGTVNGRERVFVAGENSLKLAHGQKLVLNDARAFDTYEFRQTNELVSPSGTINMYDGLYDTGVGLVTEGQVGTATFTWDTTDVRKFSLSDISGTKSAPASVLITNYLGNNELAATGLGDRALLWMGIAVVCASVVAWRLRRRIRS